MLSPVKIWRNQKNVVSLRGKTGRIMAWTVVRVPPTDFTDQAPYPVAVVELENKRKIITQVVDWNPDQLKFGQPVVTVVRRVMQPTAEGLISYGIKVKPI